MLIGLLGRTTGEGGWKEDATKFRPKRWLDAEGRFDAKVRPLPLYPSSSSLLISPADLSLSFLFPQAGPSLPFSLGPRSCFGYKLAVRFASLSLPSLFLSVFPHFAQS